MSGTVDDRSEILKRTKKVRFADEVECVEYLKNDVLCEIARSFDDLCKISDEFESKDEDTYFREAKGEAIDECVGSCTSQNYETMRQVDFWQDVTMQDEKKLKDLPNFLALPTDFPKSNKYGIKENNMTSDASVIIKETKCLSFEMAEVFSDPASRGKDVSDVSQLDENISSDISMIGEHLEKPDSHQFQPSKSMLLIMKNQSSKINSLLKRHNFSDEHSASEFKSSMFKIWQTVKEYERKMNKNKATSSPDMTDLGNKNKSYKRQMYSRKTRKRHKRKAKIDADATLSLVKVHNSMCNKKNDSESELAFKAWKMKKDALMRQRNFQKHCLEQDKRVNILISEGTQRKKSTAAYSGWKFHKYQLIQKENDLQKWMNWQQKLKSEIKAKRNEEALNVYEKWVEMKNRSHQSISYQEKKKTPWYPPG